MQLSDKDLRKAVKAGEIIIVGIDDKFPFLMNEQIQPASIDLRLGNRFIHFKKELQQLDIKELKKIEENVEEVIVSEEEGIWIHPKEVIYGQVYELIEISNNLSARIKGKSRVARLGISVFATGDYINPGFSGAMPLQIINHNHFSIKIYPYMKICQLVVYQLSEVPLIDYKTLVSLKSGYQDEQIAGLSKELLDQDENKLIKTKILNLIENYEKENNMISLSKPAQLKEEIVDNYYQNNINYLTINFTIDNNVKIEQDITNTLADIEKIYKYLDKEKDDELLSELENLKKAINEEKDGQIKSIMKKFGNTLFDIAKEVGANALIQLINKYIGS